MTAGQASEEIRRAVENRVKSINQQVRSRGTRVANTLRNAELEVLKGHRSGKLYKKAGVKRRYRASAPGEPPARRTGDLRMNWTKGVDSRNSSKSSSRNAVSVVAYLESNTPYAGYLENGTKNMAPRPFVEKIKEKAKPEIKKILEEPYT